MLREQMNSNRLSHAQWQCIREIQNKQSALQDRLEETFSRYKSPNMQKGGLMGYLEFLDDDRPFFEAFTVPTDEDGMTWVGRNNKKIGEFYILDRWNRGAPHAGVGPMQTKSKYSEIWAMSLEERQALCKKWEGEILKDLISELCRIFKALEDTRKEIEHLFGLRNTELIKEKRIIACTTTGAAM